MSLILAGAQSIFDIFYRLIAQTAVVVCAGRHDLVETGADAWVELSWM
jgi:hypothetical protein